MKQLNWYQIFGNTKQIPDGRTVTPTDDIQIWLNCADIWDKAYTTLAEVLADTDTLTALINSNNAVDYMVRSTTWAVATALVPTMTSDTTPEGVASATNVYSSTYPAWKAFDGNDDPTTSRWASTSAAAANSTWLRYQFSSPQKPDYAEVFIYDNVSTTYKIQYSNNGVDWTDATSNLTVQQGQKVKVPLTVPDNISYIQILFTGKSQSGSYSVMTFQTYNSSVCDCSTAMSYIGLNNYAANTLLDDATWCEAICNSEYFESVLNTKNPDMTSNTAPSGTCSANGNYGDYYPWKAFDGNDSTAWASPSTASLSDWIKYGFADDGIVVKRLRIYSNRYQTYKIQASNDNANWTDLYSGSVGDVTTYINNDTRYKYLKFTPTSLMGGANSGVVFTFKAYGREDV